MESKISMNVTVGGPDAVIPKALAHWINLLANIYALGDYSSDVFKFCIHWDIGGTYFEPKTLGLSKVTYYSRYKMFVCNFGLPSTTWMACSVADLKVLVVEYVREGLVRQLEHAKKKKIDVDGSKLLADLERVLNEFLNRNAAPLEAPFEIQEWLKDLYRRSEDARVRGLPPPDSLPPGIQLKYDNKSGEITAVLMNET